MAKRCEIEPDKSNPNSDKEFGLWRVYSYEVTDEHKHRDPTENEKTEIGVVDYEHAKEVMDRNNSIPR